MNKLGQYVWDAVRNKRWYKNKWVKLLYVLIALLFLVTILPEKKMKDVLFLVVFILVGLVMVIFNKPLAVYNAEKYKLFCKFFIKKKPPKSHVRFMFLFYRVVFYFVGLLMTIGMAYILFRELR